MDSFATPIAVDQVISSAAEIGGDIGAVTHGPASVADGKLLSIWPVVGEAAFLSLAVRPIPGAGASARIAAQAIRMDAFRGTEEFTAALRSRVGTLEPEIAPPVPEKVYDRSATQLLEGEIQELLETMATQPSSWEYLTGAIFERELLLQHLTGLGA